MGSDDDTCVTESVPAVQDLGGASAAKTTSSDGSAGADGSGASSPSSRRHQDQVQNSKEKRGITDVVVGPEDNHIDENKVPDKELKSASGTSKRSGRADPTPSDSSGGGGDGSGARRPWSLTEEEQEENLKNNFKRTFGHGKFSAEWARVEKSPWFAGVVAKVRGDPRRDNFEIEKMREAPFFNILQVAPRCLHMAVLMGDLEMVKKILEAPPNELHIDSRIEVWRSYSTLDLAIVCGESGIVDALLEKNAKVNAGVAGSLQLAVYHARANETENTSKIIQSLVSKGIDIKAKDHWGYSAFYLAVAQGKTDVVIELLKWKDKIQLNEACRGGRPPIQIAHEEGFKDIESELMKCDALRRDIDSAFRDRQAYVDAANAILVGAALIASVTFASWLQPPLSYTMPYHGSSVEYVDVEHNIALGSFWVFNTLSFYFAIGTVVFGAHSVLPRRQLFITENVKKLSQNLLLTSILLAFSVLFVIVAFGIAGFIVLIPILRYRWYMIGPTILGGLVCVGSIRYLFKSLWENRPWSIRNRKRNERESKDVGFPYD